MGILLFETLREHVLLPRGEGQMSKIGFYFLAFLATLTGLPWLGLATNLVAKLLERKLSVDSIDTVIICKLERWLS